MEIERKFDIKNIPSWMKEKSVRHKKIEQIYLMIDFDNDGDTDLFIGGRCISNNYGLSPVSYILMTD